ncbi:MAG: hypothetical protein KJO60_08930 [Desulfofustis sp.]|nr:hypothetical protein [Desulfofustis sp.]MBT8354633.1 hypothetical protein [Desulfofustis sp.]NNK57720.1 hypothetical protein [Desulfofustis sp.]
MIESFYNLLAVFGFHHPIHPIVVHLPMGLVVGSVAFSLADMKWPDKNYAVTAYHCILLSLISVVPVYIAGLLDWQQWFAGDVNQWIIIKLILGVALTVMLFATVQQKKKGAPQKKLFVFYLINLAICGGLGFSGGELVWGG